VETKILEIRDSGTFIPVLCVNMNPDIDHIEVSAGSPVERIKERAERYRAQEWYLSRCGYPCDGRPNIAITDLNANGRPFWNDPYAWKSDARTFPTAHHYIIDNWATLKDGDVVCVETILGERETPKVSERFGDHGR
jgi:hypothetical protein